MYRIVVSEVEKVMRLLEDRVGKRWYLKDVSESFKSRTSEP